MSGSGLVVWGGGHARAALARSAEGSLVVTWPGADPQPLRDAGVPFRLLAELLGVEAVAAAETAARSWARVWPRLPLVDGLSFRELVQWRGMSLLWATEGFLLSATSGPRCARSAELCLRLLESVRPSELDVSGMPPADGLLLARAATACGVLCHAAAGPARPLVPAPSGDSRGRLRRAFAGFSLRRRPPLERLPGGDRLLILAPAASRARLAPLLEELARAPALEVVLLEPQALERYETRRVRRAAAEAEQLLRRRLQTLRGTPALAASYVQRGVGFADLAAADLEAILLGRLPQAVRQLESAIELVETLRPGLLVLAVPERDERRTLALAAAAASVPWLALRLAAADPDDPERADGGPQPALALSLTPDQDPAAVGTRLRESVRDTVRAR